MIYRFLIATIIIVGMFILLYKLLSKDKPKTSFNILKPFNKPAFKIPIGVLAIAFTFIYSLRIIKMSPILMKIGLISLNFVVIYIVINYLFKNKQTN
jgi:hypothetical protein